MSDEIVVGSHVRLLPPHRWAGRTGRVVHVERVYAGTFYGVAFDEPRRNLKRTGATADEMELLSGDGGTEPNPPAGITPAQLAQWRAVVAAATPGPWLNLRSGSLWLPARDTAYLATFDPPTLARILDALEAGERYRAALAWYANEGNYDDEGAAGEVDSYIDDMDMITEWEPDMGARARAALAGAKNE